jgi:serine/threonine-protein kinase mTOR
MVYCKQNCSRNVVVRLIHPTQQNVAEVLHPYLLATHFDQTWYKAWHTWALANFEVISHLEGRTENKPADGNELVAHVVQAVQGMR